MIFSFEEFELDDERFELRRRGSAEPVRTEPRVLEVLVYLARHRERVVTKEELIERVWKQKFVSDSALTRSVMEARKAVGDDALRKRIIKTVHGRGYRFAAPAEERASTPPQPAAHDHSPDAATDSVFRMVA
ncbi:MAG: winged helix-turn-helix domain-containing protein, partial [Pyrinomonadaceae bacterium]